MSREPNELMTRENRNNFFPRSRVMTQFTALSVFSVPSVFSVSVRGVRATPLLLAHPAVFRLRRLLVT